MRAYVSTSGFCVASVRARLQEKSIIVSLLQAGFRRSAPRYQRPGPISRCGRMWPSELRWRCIRFQSTVQQGQAGRKARLESFRLSTLILEASDAADAERPPREGSRRGLPGWNQIRSSSHASSVLHRSWPAQNWHLRRRTNTQETNTLECDPFQRPIWYLYFPFPLRTLGDLSRRPRPLGPRLPALHGPQSGRPQVLTAGCLPQYRNDGATPQREWPARHSARETEAGALDL